MILQVDQLLIENAYTAFAREGLTVMQREIVLAGAGIILFVIMVFFSKPNN